MRTLLRPAATSLLLLLALSSLVACGGSAPTSPPSAPAGSPLITAANLQFDRDQLAVPADAPFTLVFENREVAPHNVAIYTDSSASQTVFKGEVFSGPATRNYAVPALPAGRYYFRCDLHPAMDGTVTAG